jgi:hypothetical protein
MTLAAIGIKPAQEHSHCADGAPVSNTAIGFALNKRLGLALFHASAQAVRLIETDVIHQQTFYKELVSTYWVEPQVTYTVEGLRGIAQRLQVDLLAFSRIVSSRVSGSTISLPWGEWTKQTLRVEVEVCLYEPAAPALGCQVVERIRTQQASTGGPGEVDLVCRDLVDNLAESATQQALEQAVQALLIPVRFE